MSESTPIPPKDTRAYGAFCIERLVDNLEADLPTLLMKYPKLAVWRANVGRWVKEVKDHGALGTHATILRCDNISAGLTEIVRQGAAAGQVYADTRAACESLRILLAGLAP